MADDVVPNERKTETETTPFPNDAANDQTPTVAVNVRVIGAGAVGAQNMNNVIVNNTFSQPMVASGENKDLALNLKRMLETRYDQIQAPTLPWLEGLTSLPLDDLYVDLEMHKRDSRGREQNGVSVEREDIFADWNEQFTDLSAEKAAKVDAKPVHILIEGGPGFGKSTLALKLAQDWAKGKEYLGIFFFVVLLQLRQFKGSLASAFGSALKLVNHSEEDTLKEVGQRRTLLILDGYDELSDEQAQLLMPLVRKKMFPNMSLVVISRPGKTTELNECFSKRIIIKGIPVERQSQFLAKYLETFDRQRQDALMNKLQTFDLQDDFLKCPLILLLVVILTQECDIAKLQTKSDVYKHLFNLVVQRGLQKNKKTTEKIDLFLDWDCNKIKEWPFYVSLMDKFGELSFKALQNRQTTFTRLEILANFDENDETILLLDFFTLNESVNGIFLESWYEPVHLTFLEFGAAYHLWLSCHDLQEKYLKLGVVRLFKDNWINTSYGSDDPVWLFLGEMLENDDHFLVRTLRMCHEEFSKELWFAEYSHLLIDLQTPVSDLVSELDCFIPRKWHVNREAPFFKSYLHREILSQGIRSQKIETIQWNIAYEANIPKEEIPIQFLILDIAERVKAIANKSGDEIRCCHLQCIVGDFVNPIEVYHSFAAFLKKIIFTDISFHLWSLCKTLHTWLTLISKESIDGFLKLHLIKCINCSFSTGDVQEPLKHLEGLVKREKVSQLNLSVYSGVFNNSNLASGDLTNYSECNLVLVNPWESFCKTVGKSKCLTRLHLNNMDERNVIVIDEELVTDSGKKFWDLLDFRRNVILKKTTHD